MRLYRGLLRAFDALVLGHPALTLAALTVLLGGVLVFVRDFELDASSDSLVLEDDPALRYYRATRSRYGSDDYLIVTYTPHGELFTEETLAQLRAMRDQLAALPRVSSVGSILDAPLFQSPPVTLFSMGDDYKTLEMQGVDADLAVAELRGSPLYRNLLLSPDGVTTALQVNFTADEAYTALQRRRDALREQKYTTGLEQAEVEELAQLDGAIAAANTHLLAEQEQDVARVRAVIRRYENGAQVFLGGIPMIVVDMIAYVQSDLVVFGATVVGVMAVTLALIFRLARWVFLPVGIALLTGFVTMGYLGLVGWKVTVISSNFFSLVLIMTFAILIHLVVRYRELNGYAPHASRRELVIGTVGSMARPCFYTTVTTMVAFGSLIVSGIRPVIDFGWMMVLGVGLGLTLSFLLLPVALTLLPRIVVPAPVSAEVPLTSVFARLTERHGGKIVALFILTTLVAIAGFTRLSVDNRFTDYFKETTEIYQGLAAIDSKLGGTTPLEVIIEGQGERYFEDPTWRDTVRDIDRFLDALPETGKVLSASTFMHVAEEVNDGFPLDNFYLNLIERKLPADVRRQVLDPYASREHDELRFAMRVRETDPGLKRQQLVEVIRDQLVDRIGIPEGDVRLTGMLVLYNNMLMSLFRSQILTLGAVFAAITVMFLIIFRSLRVALVAIVPNAFPAILVLGVMGWAGIPLDMMTITIAAIAVGIGVHDTIHYLHRFRDELERDGDYLAAMHRSHATIGRAMFYTTLTITVGFSVLALSNFVPTIYFGLFTGLAMVVALLADLIVLPELLIAVKPLGKGAVSDG